MLCKPTFTKELVFRAKLWILMENFRFATRVTTLHSHNCYAHNFQVVVMLIFLSNITTILAKKFRILGRNGDIRSLH